MHRLLSSIVVLAWLSAAPSPGFAQTVDPRQTTARPKEPGRITTEEATALTNGWALLAQGLEQDAVRKAEEVLARHPRSIAALSLRVEAELARSGFLGGLGVYERWLGNRTLEEPGIMRRLATALLREAAAQSSDPLTRIEALKALAAAGVPGATEVLAESPTPANLRVLAALGNETAVNQLAAQLKQGQPDTLATLEALGKSGRRSVIPVVAVALTDQREEVRATAADALVELDARDRLPDLKRLLSDRSLFVRTHAARALFRMGDLSGVQILEQLAGGDAAMSRFIAAEAMATSPDQSWLAQVRSLTSAAEPEVRALAARLIAPHDPDLARRTLEALGNDSNMAVRELAERTLAETLTSNDLGTLRRLFRSADSLTRIRAAASILRITG